MSGPQHDAVVELALGARDQLFGLLLAAETAGKVVLVQVEAPFPGELEDGLIEAVLVRKAVAQKPSQVPDRDHGSLGGIGVELDDSVQDYLGGGGGRGGDLAEAVGGSFLRVAGRSEERRVGKECRSRWSPYH